MKHVRIAFLIAIIGVIAISQVAMAAVSLVQWDCKNIVLFNGITDFQLRAHIVGDNGESFVVALRYWEGAYFTMSDWSKGHELANYRISHLTNANDMEYLEIVDSEPLLCGESVGESGAIHRVYLPFVQKANGTFK